MVRNAKKLISIRHILAALLICAIFAPVFFIAMVPSAEATAAVTCAKNVAADSKAAAAISAGRVLHVCGYDSQLAQAATITKKITSNPSLSLSWEYNKRFYTLSEAFWYIHSGGQDGHTASNDANQDAWQAADWVILVKGIQQFKTGGSTMEYSLTQIKRGLNPCYETTDEEGTGIYTYGINGRHKYTETQARSSSTASGYSVSCSWSTGATYNHSGTWFITGVGAGQTYHTTSGVGSKIYFNLGSSLRFSTGGPIHFSNIDLITNKNVHFYAEEGFYVGENVLTPNYTYSGSGDSTASNNKYMFSVYAGPGHTTTLSANSNIILSSGNWRTIMGASNRGNITGNVTISIYGSAYIYSNLTCGFDKTVTGNITVYLANKFLAFLYPSPRSGGTVTGTTNIYLLNGCTVMNMTDVTISATTKMGAVNVHVENGSRLLNCSAKWSNSNLSGGNVTATLNLNGIQGGFRDEVSFAGFDKINLTNGTKISYRSTFLSGSSLTVNSGCNLYLSQYTSDSNLKSTVTSLTKNGTIRYVLVYYVDQASSPSSLNFTYIVGFNAENPDNGQVSLGIDGYTPDTAFQSLAAAYAKADVSTLKVNCEFIISGSTTEPAALAGNSYSTALPNYTVTISAINNATLTLPTNSSFGYTTYLENISIAGGYLYSGQNLTVDPGTVFTTSPVRLYSGWNTAACTNPCTITLNDGEVSEVWMGNPVYNIGTVDLNINNSATALNVYCGHTKQVGSLNITVNGIGTATDPNVKYILATPYGTASAKGVNTGDVTINLLSGALGDSDEDIPGNLKLFDYAEGYTGNVGVLNGDITVNVTDDFIYVPDYFFPNNNTDNAGNSVDKQAFDGTLTVNLMGWTDELTEADATTMLTNADKLGAKTYNGVATDTVCNAVIPTSIISDASNTATYYANMDADTGNKMYFHNDAYDYLVKTASSGGTLTYGHDLSAIVASKDATSDAKGNIQYCSCSICSKYFADVANANAETQITDHNGDGNIDINDVYRYWYTVTIIEKTNDGGDGGSFDKLTVGADERYDLPTITASPNAYYSFTNYYADEACTNAATSLGTISAAAFTPNGAKVRAASGSVTGGDVEVYGLFSRKLATLVIDRNAAFDETQVFVYKVVCNEPVGPTLYVTVSGNGSTTITKVPQGSYTVTQLNDWSWRYNSRVDQEVNLIVDGANDTAAYGDTNYNASWIDCNTTITKK